MTTQQPKTTFKSEHRWYRSNPFGDESCLYCSRWREENVEPCDGGAHIYDYLAIEKACNGRGCGMCFSCMGENLK